MIEITYPVRINKYLAATGVSTRRGADILIESGNVTINGKKARLGDIVNAGDTVQTSGHPQRKCRYVAYYKTRGLETKDIAQSGALKKLFPVGRLDKESEGLLILTDDGRITDRLLNPKFDHEKEYVVEVDKPLSNRLKNVFEKGVFIEGYKTKPARVEMINELTFRVVITEGKKHQIRRMCAALGYQVKKLKRIRVMNISLGRLSPGKNSEITGSDLKNLLMSLDLIQE